MIDVTSYRGANIINMGNECYYGLRNVLRSKLLRKDTKCTIYKALIRQMVLYGCESWILKKTDNEKHSISERKILKKIYGPTSFNGVWRIKYDDDLHSLYKEPSIVKIIKIARLKWLGHTARMEDNVPCMKITFSQPEGSRKERSPILRWLE